MLLMLRIWIFHLNSVFLWNSRSRFSRFLWIITLHFIQKCCRQNSENTLMNESGEVNQDLVHVRMIYSNTCFIRVFRFIFKRIEKNVFEKFTSLDRFEFKKQNFEIVHLCFLGMYRNMHDLKIILTAATR